MKKFIIYSILIIIGVAAITAHQLNLKLTYMQTYWVFISGWAYAFIYDYIWLKHYNKPH